MSTFTESQQWWLNVNGRPEGPQSVAQITHALQMGELSWTTSVCPQGGHEWRPICDWPAWSQLRATATSTAAKLPSEEIRTLALWHRRFTLGILAMMVGVACLLASSSVALKLFAILANGFLQVLLTIGLCRALRSRAAVLWALTAVVPYLGLIPLLLVSRRATKRLKQAGVPVGLLGAKLPFNEMK